MLDLTQHVNKYEIKWFDGQVLHLDMPSQEFLMKVTEIEKMEDESEQFKCLVEIMEIILNHNAEGRKFSKEEIEAISVDTIELILTDYVDFIYKCLGE